MTDITPIFNDLLKSRNGGEAASKEARFTAAQTTDEFLKEAYRINSHISSLLSYLKSLRQSYLSTAPSRPGGGGGAGAVAARRADPNSFMFAIGMRPANHLPSHLTDEDRDTIDSEAAGFLRNLSSSISNLASAENLRRETQATVLRKKFPLTNSAIWKWASGGDASGRAVRSPAQERLEEQENTTKAVRESVLCTLRQRLEGVTEYQRDMVEKRIERIKEKEKSVLYKMNKHGVAPSVSVEGRLAAEAASKSAADPTAMRGTNMLQENEVAEIESQLSPEQLQLFAEENDTMLRHYEDTLGKVQNAEKSLLDISELQQTIVSHLSTQEEYINQLVTDASNTQTNVTQGNRELKHASERRSVARLVFWSTVGFCTWLIVWDAIF
ncbi:hypothetical protein KEM55_004758 [Ascosphaera atra]|nr:hypothetical protein KEM55_004758 [Ascosphaera atra]